MFEDTICVCVCQISMKEHLEDSLLECTMQDLLRYDDYNNDGHLSLHEFYTAFRESLFHPHFFPFYQFLVMHLLMNLYSLSEKITTQT